MPILAAEPQVFPTDLFHHDGDVEPITESDILGRVRRSRRDGEGK